MNGWRTIGSAPEGVEVETKIEDANGCRNVQTLVRQGNLWWLYPDMSVHVYYCPTHWRPISEKGTGR